MKELLTPRWDMTSTLLVSRDVRVRRLDDEWIVHFRPGVPANYGVALSDGAFTLFAGFGSGVQVANCCSESSDFNYRDLLERFVRPGLLISTEYELDGVATLISPQEVMRLRSALPLDAAAMFELETVLLYLLTRDNPFPQPVCELGSWKGGSTIALGLGALNSRQKNRVIAVDDHEWHRHAVNELVAEDAKLTSTLPEFEANLARAGVSEIVDIVVGDTARVGERFTDGVSVLLVDASHDEQAVERDIEAWLPKVVPGGFLLFHDYGNPSWPEVQPTVDNFRGAFESFSICQTLAVARKTRSIAN